MLRWWRTNDVGSIIVAKPLTRSSSIARKRGWTNFPHMAALANKYGKYNCCILLASNPVIFGDKALYCVISLDKFGILPSIALILYFIYLSLFFFIGIDGLYELNEFQREHRKYQTFILFPAIGFGLAIFPKCATEYIFDYWSFNEFDFYVKYTAIIGWTVILFLFSVVLL